MAPFERRRPAILAAVALLALSSACADSPTGPKPLGVGILAVGTTVQGTIHSLADSAHFSLVLTGGKDAMVYLMAKGDWLRLEVRDSTGELVTATSDMFNPTNPERRGTAIIPASPFRYRVDVSMVQGTAPSDYEIRVVAASTAPEHVPPTLTVGTIVSGEDLDHAYDVDSFTVSVDHDEVVNLYLRKTTVGPAIVTARVFRAGIGWYPLGTSAGAADTVLGALGSGRFTLTAGVPYWIRVYYQIAYDPPDTGRTGYELQLRKIDPAPEAARSAIVPGDTVHESIDYLGDVDEFTLSGTAGTGYNLFADAGGDAPHRITAQLVAVNATEPSVTASAGGPPLAENATGVFTMPSNGLLTVRVSDGDGSTRGHVGPYRLFVYPIDSGTESATTELALDRVTTSAVDMLGDVDVFRLTLATDTAVNMTMWRPRGPGLVTFTLRDSSGVVVARRTPGVLPTPGDTAAVGTRLLRAGTYTLSIEPSSSAAGGFTGEYEIFPRSINRAPESVPVTMAVGDTIRGESLDAAGDIDRFAVSLNADDSVYVYLKASAPEVRVGAGLRRASDETFFGIDAFNFAAGGTTEQSRLFVAPTTGLYYLEVSGETAGVNQGETGAYTVSLPRITAAPEDRAASVALGDTVAGSVDVAGDVDDYVLSAPAGTEVTGALRTDADNSCCVEIRFIDPATGAVLAQSTNRYEGFGRVTVPAGGVLGVRLSNVPGCSGYECFSPEYRRSYRFWVERVNRAPESRGAAFAIGDTVSGEAIDPAGDIDEFTFDATAGDTVDVFFQTPMGTLASSGLTMTLIDAASGTTLGTLTSNYSTPNLGDIALTRVALPTTGSYMIRVVGTDDVVSEGVFRFRVARPGQ